ncbi:MAG TPA: tetratricopeptide repeat protein [Caldithrix abyssi]|uniref:Tetratricopeptide repeat protein n=1 Tax=Caldithrix abyssi TaxID=187145 RepID=A0A7V5UF17_CALAY|nr:tetratricopeptide repeat protein [Caldithrix abyssi]
MMKKFTVLFLSVLLTGLLSSCIPFVTRDSQPVKPAIRNYRKGLTWLERGDYIQAEVLFKLALRDSVSFAPAYVGLARTYFLQGKYAKAERYVNKAIDYDPRNPVARFLRAKIFYRIGAYDFALNEMDFCLKNTCFSRQPNLVIPARLLMARINFRMGRFQQARDYYWQVLKAAPEHPQAVRGLRETERMLQLVSGKSALFRKIPGEPQVTRADMAVILKEELAELFPESADDSAAVKMPADADSSLPQYAAIKYVLQRGWLPVLPDSTFRPSDTVDRAEFVLFVRRVVRSLHDIPLPFDAQSPSFTDISPSDPLFPAVKTIFSLGCFSFPPEKKNFSPQKKFFPRRKISGLQAIRAIQCLKEKLEEALFPADADG